MDNSHAFGIAIVRASLACAVLSFLLAALITTGVSIITGSPWSELPSFFSPIFAIMFTFIIIQSMIERGLWGNSNSLSRFVFTHLGIPIESRREGILLIVGFAACAILFRVIWPT